jgi:hypothetical protein
MVSNACDEVVLTDDNCTYTKSCKERLPGPEYTSIKNDVSKVSVSSSVEVRII